MTKNYVAGLMNRLASVQDKNASIQMEAVPEGYDAYLIGTYVATAKSDVLYVLREDLRMASTEAALDFFHPDLEVISIPAWDCLPYDRVSPNGETVAHRMTSLAKLTEKSDKPRLILTTVNAMLQRVPTHDMIKAAKFEAKVGDKIDLGEIDSSSDNVGGDHYAGIELVELLEGNESLRLLEVSVELEDGDLSVLLRSYRG